MRTLRQRARQTLENQTLLDLGKCAHFERNNIVVLANLNRAQREARTSRAISRRTNVRQLTEASRFVAVCPTRQASGWAAQRLTVQTPCVRQQIRRGMLRKAHKAQGSCSRWHRTHSLKVSAISMYQNRQNGDRTRLRAEGVVMPSRYRQKPRAHVDATRDRGFAKPSASPCDRCAWWPQPPLAQTKQRSTPSQETYATKS